MANIQQEIWKPIQGYENHYEISNLGRLRGLDRIISCHKTFHRKHFGKILSESCDSDGYRINILLKNGCRWTAKIHRLVAFAFIPNPDNLPEVNHINGIKTDNRVENLEWCNSQQNQLHAYRIGLQKNGEGHSRAKLKEHEVIKIFHDKRKDSQIEKEYNVSRGAIRSIKLQKTWKHVVKYI